MLRRYTTYRFIFFILVCGNVRLATAHSQKVSFFAEQVLNEIPSSYQAESIIEHNEWHELKIDDLLTKLDCTKTSFGPWGLRFLTCPIADIPEIQSRQEILVRLIEHDQLSSKIRVLLEQLAQSEQSLLAYWDENDQLSHRARHLYFSIPYLKEHANNNRLLLEGAMLFEWSKSLLNFAKTLCIDGLLEEIGFLLIGGQDTFDWRKGLSRGFSRHIKNNNPFPEITKKEGYQNNFKEFRRIWWNGTLGDRIYIGARGYDRILEKIKLPFFELKNVLISSSRTVDITTTAISASIMLAYTLWCDWRLYRQAQDVYKQLIFLHTVANALQRRLVNVAAFIHKAKRLYHIINNDSVLSDSRVAVMMRDILDSEKISKTLSHLFVLLQKPTFKKPADIFYSRGCVLFAHKKLQEVKQELVPLLQAIAELDAYYSIAILFKKYETTNTPFCFASFVDREKPLLDCTACWLPVLSDDQVVTNDVSLGTDTQHPTKLIITGPNGCGKSTYLKMLGQIAVLAQSWGIVPAARARMTPLQGMRSCLASYEDISSGLSTFMAEDKRMLEVQNFVDSCALNKKVMIVIDEPWRGTVDAASAHYIYRFGQHIAPLENCITCIATHVQKPIELADETQGIFTNVHVAIDEDDHGFVRTFTLQPGPALWWFNDIDRRTRFIEWLKTMYGARSIKLASD
jgi:hypothetical protein